MSNTFVYKPTSESKGTLVVVVPSSLTGNTRSVEIVDKNGNVIESGRYRSSGNGNRGNWDFRNRGGAYAGNTVRITKDDGTIAMVVPIGNGSRIEQNYSGGTVNPSEINYQGAGVTQGNNIQGGGGTGVVIPDFVNFDPTQFYINYDEAQARAEAQSGKNVDQFGQNFDLSGNLALQNLGTEIKGLEAYLPRSTALIKKADAQTNQDTLAYSNLFDQRNLQATQTATNENVQQRSDLVDKFAPGTIDSQINVRDRLEGDIAKIRERESSPLISDPLKETAARSARNTAADQGAAGGFGIDSASTRNLLDRFDFDKRFEIEQANREDARRGDTAIQTGEQAILSANTSAQNSFNALIAPGIQDFKASQPTPVVTDIGAQIKASPANDAASIQRNLNAELTPLTTIQPTTAFQNSFEEQKHNRGIDLQALQFQQEQFNTIASAINESSDLVTSEQRYEDQRALFQQALEDKRNGQQIQGFSSLLTAGLGIVGNLVSEYIKNPSAENKKTVEGWIKWGEELFGKGWASNNTVNGTNGPIDISQFNPDESTGTGGFWDSWGTGSTSNVNTGLQDPFGGGDSGVNSTNDSSVSSSGDFSFDSSGDFTGGSSSSSSSGSDNYTLDGFSWNGAEAQSSSTAKARTLKSLKSSNFEGSDQLATEFDNLTPEQRNDAYTQLDGLLEGLDNPATRGDLVDELKQYGLSEEVVGKAVNLYTNWNNINDRDRAYATASILNEISTNLGTGTLPAYALPIVNAIRQGANLYNNWDDLSEGQRAAGVVQVSGGIAAAYATYLSAAQTGGAVGGPVGAAIAVAAVSVARSTQTLVDEGFTGSGNIVPITDPVNNTRADIYTGVLEASGVDSPVNRNDLNNAILLYNPLTFYVGVYSVLGGDLDFSSGKSKDQQYRDAFRKFGEDPRAGGFLTKNDKGSHEVTLASGNKFDIGKDGNAKLKNVGTNIDGKAERRYSDVDWSNPIINEVVAMANPLSILIYRSAEAKRMVGHMTNAITSENPTDLKAAKANAKNIALQAGMDYASGVAGLTEMKDKKQLDQHTFDVYLKSWQNLMLR